MPRRRRDIDVIWSAAPIGTVQLPLLLADVEIAAVVVIVLSVTVIGCVCATARARTGSLRPAIAAPAMFNVGGFLTGVIYTIAHRGALGRPNTGTRDHSSTVCRRTA